MYALYLFIGFCIYPPFSRALSVAAYAGFPRSPVTLAVLAETTSSITASRFSYIQTIYVIGWFNKNCKLITSLL